jgi:hypothetical protein
MRTPFSRSHAQTAMVVVSALTTQALTAGRRRSANETWPRRRHSPWSAGISWISFEPLRGHAGHVAERVEPKMSRKGPSIRHLRVSGLRSQLKGQNRRNFGWAPCGSQRSIAYHEADELWHSVGRQNKRGMMPAWGTRRGERKLAAAEIGSTAMSRAFKG